MLSNLESHNAELIKEDKSKEERFEILSEIAKYQLNILNNAEKIKLLGDEKDNEEGAKKWTILINKIRQISTGWLRFIATPSKNLINKGFPWFLILHIFDKKRLKSFKIDKNIANLMIFMMGIRMVITSLQPHKKLSLQQENSCYTFSFAKKV